MEETVERFTAKVQDRHLITIPLLSFEVLGLKVGDMVNVAVKKVTVRKKRDRK